MSMTAPRTLRPDTPPPTLPSTPEMLPRRHPDLVLTSDDDLGSTTVYNPRTGAHLRLGRGAGDLLAALDGRPADGRFDPTSRATNLVIDGFRRHRLLVDDAAEVDPVETALDSQRRRVHVTGVASLELDLGDPSLVLGRWRPVLERLATWPVERALIVLGAAGAAAAVAASESITTALASTGTTAMLSIVAAALLLAVLAHQLARALTLTAVGGTVRRVGLAVRGLLPRLFLDLTDACLVLRSGQLRAVSRSGLAGNAVVASLAALAVLMVGGAVPWLTSTLSWVLVVNLAVIAVVVALSPIARPLQVTTR